MECLKMAVLLLVMLLFSSSTCEAKELLVGGTRSSWQIPSSPDVYDKWAQSKRFRIGDSIVARYDGKSGDSVLEVGEEGYKSCNKSNPIQSYHNDDGVTRITLDRPGFYYFISGAEGHCEKGQKLVIRVQSVKPHDHSPFAPVPSPADHHHYAPAPANKKNGCAHHRSLGAASLVVMMGIIMSFV